MMEREKWKKTDYQNNLDMEKELVRVDQERARDDRNNKRQRKIQMAATLRDTLIQQQNQKREVKQKEVSDNAVFSYMFPFSESPESFFISPKKFQNDDDVP